MEVGVVGVVGVVVEVVVVVVRVPVVVASFRCLLPFDMPSSIGIFGTQFSALGFLMGASMDRADVAQTSPPVAGCGCCCRLPTHQRLKRHHLRYLLLLLLNHLNQLTVVITSTVWECISGPPRPSCQKIHQKKQVLLGT